MLPITETVSSTLGSVVPLPSHVDTRPSTRTGVEHPNAALAPGQASAGVFVPFEYFTEWQQMGVPGEPETRTETADAPGL